jgi:hypothetical protein
MPRLRKVPQVMFKTTEMSQQVPFFFCLFSGSILSLSFSFFPFVSFFYVTEGEKQGSGVDSVCGVIKREMVAAR